MLRNMSDQLLDNHFHQLHRLIKGFFLINRKIKIYKRQNNEINMIFRDTDQSISFEHKINCQYKYSPHNYYNTMKNLQRVSKALALILCVVCLSSASKFQDYHIIKADRAVQLNAAYPIEITKLQYVCLKQKCPSHVYYTIPDEYSEKTNKIAFTKNKGDQQTYPSKLQKYQQNGFAYDLFKIELPNDSSKGDQFTMYVQVTYINRYGNYPVSISLTEDQKFEYQDNKCIVAPYTIKQSSVSYKFAKILDYEQDGQKKGLSGANFKENDINPFSSQEKHTLHGVNNDPQVVFSEVQRIIEVSHWGNIAVVEFYKLQNTGPELKGQFSRIQFSSQNSFEAKNAFRGVQTTLPFQIWGLYYRDEVGNISTSRAYKDEYNKQVKFALTPRYALLGGWKCNWQIGYNLNTKGFLSHDGNSFALSKIPIQYAFGKILTQKYKMRIILPQGSSNPKFYVDNTLVQMSNVLLQTSFGYLDFSGRPLYTIPDLKGNFAGKQLKVTYSYDQSNIFKKPLIIFCAIFGVLFTLIVLKRLNMDTFSENQHQKSE